MGREKDKGDTPGYKEDLGKFEWSLLPLSALEGCVRVLMFGAKKYTKHNWRCGMIWSRPYDALQRHLIAWFEGEDLDKETGLNHLHHAMCELVFLIYYTLHERYRENDDRYKGG